MHRDSAPIIIGALLIWVGLFYAGTYNGFNRRGGPPDNPPNKRTRWILVLGGIAAIVLGVRSFLN